MIKHKRGKKTGEEDSLEETFNFITYSYNDAFRCGWLWQR